MRKWNCVCCGWTTTDYTIDSCPDCRCNMYLIPKRLNNNLFLATICIIEDYYSGIEAILDNNEDALDICEIHSGKRLKIIKDWNDFEYFFGRYFTRKLNVNLE